jgi:hypothetical protein
MGSFAVIIACYARLRVSQTTTNNDTESRLKKAAPYRLLHPAQFG